MKILVLSGLGYGCPDAIKDKMNTWSIQERIDIVEWVEKNCSVCNQYIHNDDWYKNNRDELVRMTLKGTARDIYFGYCSESNTIVQVSVVEVNTGKKWYIRCIEGQEIVTYLPKFECVDEKYNFYKKV